MRDEPTMLSHKGNQNNNSLQRGPGSGNTLVTG
jgi:hypothetical protein